MNARIGFWVGYVAVILGSGFLFGARAMGGVLIGTGLLAIGLTIRESRRPDA
jgi:hypothetical protein